MPAGMLSDRIGAQERDDSGFMIFSIVYLGSPIAMQDTFVDTFAIYGFYIAMTDGVSKA